MKPLTLSEIHSLSVESSFYEDIEKAHEELKRAASRFQFALRDGEEFFLYDPNEWPVTFVSGNCNFELTITLRKRN